MVQAGLQDSVLIQKIIEAQVKLNPGFDWQSLLVIIGTCVSIPLCIWLINVVRGVNATAVDKINTSLENLGNKFEEEYWYRLSFYLIYFCVINTCSRFSSSPVLEAAVF